MHRISGLAFLLSLVLASCSSSVFEEPEPWKDPPKQVVRTTSRSVRVVTPSPMVADDKRLERARDVLEESKFLDRLDDMPRIPRLDERLQPEDAAAVRSGTAAVDVCAVIAGDSWSFFDALYGATAQRLKQVYPGCQVEYWWTADGGAIHKFPSDPSQTWKCPPDEGQWDPKEGYRKCGHSLPYLLTYPGTEAFQWSNPHASRLIAWAVRRHTPENGLPPVVVLYLGGNDLIRESHKDKSTAERQGIVKSIVERIQQVVANVERELAPNPPNFVLVGYVYPNLKGGDSEGAAHRWNQAAANEELERLSAALKRWDDSKTNLAYIDNLDRARTNEDGATDKSRMVNLYLHLFGWKLAYLWFDNIHVGKPEKFRVAEHTVRRIWDECFISRPDCPAR